MCLLLASQQHIGDVFSRLADYAKMYTQYCGAQPGLLSTIEEDRKEDKKLAAFLDEVKFSTPEARGLDIGQYLLKPVQRVCKYPLLLGDILKHTSESHADHGKIIEALAKTNAVVESINEGRRVLETINKVADLAADIKEDAPDFDLLSGQRSFIREGPFIEVREGGKEIPCTLVLFDDFLILGKYVQRKTKPSSSSSSSSGSGWNPNLSAKQFQYRSHWPLKDIRCDEFPNPRDEDQRLCGFQLLFKGDAPLSLQCTSREVRYLWFSELQQYIEEARGGGGAGSAVKSKARAHGRQNSLASPSPAAAKQAAPLVEFRRMGPTHEALVAEWRLGRAKELRQRAEEEDKLRSRYIDSLSSDWGGSGGGAPSSWIEADVLSDPKWEASSDLAALFRVSAAVRPAQRPEIVIFGEKGAGKSTLLDSLIGMPLLAGIAPPSRDKTPAAVIVKVQLKHVSDRKKPRWVVNGGAPCSTLADARELLSSEMRLVHHAKKDPADGSVTVSVVYESGSCVDLILWELPAPQLVANFSGPPFIFLCVQAARDWASFPEQLHSLVLRHIDPLLERTFFVYTKFVSKLLLFLDARDFERWLEQCPTRSRSWFVELLAPTARIQITEQAAFLQELSASDALLQRLLDQYRHVQLQGTSMRDFRVELSRVIVSRLQHGMFAQALSHMNAEYLKAEARAQVLGATLKKGDAQSQTAATQALTGYLHRFTTAFVAGIEGSGVGARGRTHADELGRDGGWRVHVLGAEPVVVPVDRALSECKLSGGAQLQRLLAEFRALVALVKLPLPSSDHLPSEGLPRESRAVVTVEMVQKSLALTLGPACREFSRRAEEIIRQLSETAQRNALSTASEQELALLQNMNLTVVSVSVLTDWAIERLHEFQRQCFQVGDSLSLHPGVRRVLRGDFGNAENPSSDLGDSAALVLKDFLSELPLTVMDILSRTLLEPLQDVGIISTAVFVRLAPASETTARIFNAASYKTQQSRALADATSNLERLKRERDVFLAHYGALTVKFF